MKNPLSGKEKSGESRKISWKRRPSEIRGYSRTLYLNTDSGDYIRVDYNTKDKKVRLYVEDAEEGGIPYYSVINNGKIAAEKNAQTGRPHDLSEKFGQRSEIFATIGNREVLKLINKNYGIGQGKKKKDPQDDERKKVLERTRQRYFKPDDQVGAGGAKRMLLRFRVDLIDLIDIAIGVLLTAIVYLYEYDFVSSGILAAFYGIIIGTVDILLRGDSEIFANPAAPWRSNAWPAATSNIALRG